MTNIKSGSTPGKVTPKRKAAGGIKSTTATNSVSHTDSTGSDPAQLHLDLGGKHAAAPPTARRPVRRISTSTTLPNDKPGTKLETILLQFLMGRNMNRFEAEHYHDHCLHSTVSTLQNDYGILIARQSETIPCLRGRSSVRCMRYWLDTSPDNITAARALLSMLEKRA
jgi:hypothetical protein